VTDPDREIFGRLPKVSVVTSLMACRTEVREYGDPSEWQCQQSSSKALKENILRVGIEMVGSQFFADLPHLLLTCLHLLSRVRQVLHSI
jgi:hypothetical protein